MTLLVIAILMFVLLCWYALWGRPWLKAKPWAKPFFDRIEPVEIVLFKKSETILFARMKMLTGLLLAVLTSMGTIDLSSIMPFVPEKYQGWLRVAFNLLPLILSVTGWMDEQLRKKTTLPIEVVAVPDKTIAENPKVAEAVAMAIATKAEAVNAVVEAKVA